jgi:hypothetical protein
MASKASQAGTCGICSEQSGNVTGFSLGFIRVCFIHIYLSDTDTIGSVFKQHTSERKQMRLKAYVKLLLYLYQYCLCGLDI